MKKFVFLLAVLSSAVVLNSCMKELQEDNTLEVSTNTITLVVDAGLKGEEAERVDMSDTKTVISGSSIKWSSSGERITVYEKATKDGSTSMANKSSNVGSTTDSYVTMSFNVSLEGKTADNFTYYGSYPSSANVSTNSTQAKANLETIFAQTPVAASFDPSADLMISKSIDNDDDQATSLSMQFARVIAIGKMTIENLPVDEFVSKVTFSADNGSAVTLAGRTNFDLDAAVPVTDYGDALAKTEIVLNTSALSAKATSSMDVWFTCYPFVLTTGDTFTVVVEAGAYQIARTVTIPAARELNFVEGKVSRFSVDMSTADVAMQQPWVLYEGAFTAGDYLIVSAGKAMKASITSNRFDYTTISAVNNEVYTNDANLVWRAAASSTYWTLYNPEVDKYAASTGAASKAQLLGSDADDKKLWSASGDGTYEFVNKQNTTNGVNANLRLNGSYGFACYGTGTGSALLLYKKDSRPYLATPASVTAALNGSDDSVIDVTFGTVANAGSYVIVATPTVGDVVVKEGILASPATISVSDGLAYETTYSISVYAVPSVPASYRSSLTKNASGTVTTGEIPAAANGTTLWGEAFAGFAANNVPASSNANTIVYGGQTVTYSVGDGGTTTKIYAETSAGGTSPELLISKGSGYLTATNIPTGSATNMILSFKANNDNIVVSSTTEGKSITYVGKSGSTYTYGVTVPSATKTLDLTFTNNAGASTNIRIDDICLVVGVPKASTPVIAFENNIVSISCATAGTSIYYTVDGTTPDSEKTLYSEPFEISSEKTIKAIAIKGGLNNSEVAERLCTPKVSTPVISSSDNSFTITCATDGATIYYEISTTNLASVATPTTSSASYTAAVDYAATTYVKAYAVKAGYTDSDVESATCTYSSGGGPSTTTLTNANIVAAGDAADSYSLYNLTDSNSNSYSAYAIKKAHSGATSDKHYLQIKKYASSTAYYISIPTLGSKITEITMTVSSTSKAMDGGGNSATLFFSASNSTSATGSGIASGTGSSSVTIDCSSINLNSGYITASAGVRIWDIEITYDN